MYVFHSHLILIKTLHYRDIVPLTKKWGTFFTYIFNYIRGGGLSPSCSVAKLGKSVKNNGFLRPLCCYFWPILAGKGKDPGRGRFTNWKLGENTGLVFYFSTLWLQNDLPWQIDTLFSPSTRRQDFLPLWTCPSRPWSLGFTQLYFTPSGDFQSNPIHPLLAYAATSVSDGVFSLHMHKN